MSISGKRGRGEREDGRALAARRRQRSDIDSAKKTARLLFLRCSQLKKRKRGLRPPPPTCELVLNFIGSQFARDKGVTRRRARPLNGNYAREVLSPPPLPATPRSIRALVSSARFREGEMIL